MPAAASLRSPVWLTVCWLIGCACLLTAVATISTGSAGEAIFVTLLMGVPGAWVVGRVPLMRVRLTDAGLQNHGLFRTRRAAWADISGVEVEPVNGGDLPWQSFAPVLHLDDGQEWPLMQLAGYSSESRVRSSRVGRQTEQIRHYLAQ